MVYVCMYICVYASMYVIDGKIYLHDIHKNLMSLVTQIILIYTH